MWTVARPRIPICPCLCVLSGIELSIYWLDFQCRLVPTDTFGGSQCTYCMYWILSDPKGTRSARYCWLQVCSNVPRFSFHSEIFHLRSIENVKNSLDADGPHYNIFFWECVYIIHDVEPLNLHWDVETRWIIFSGYYSRLQYRPVHRKIINLPETHTNVLLYEVVFNAHGRMSFKHVKRNSMCKHTKRQ